MGFKNFGDLTDQQKNFNKKLSHCRVVIENSFAYLKGRFRRLKYIETVLLVVSGCIMHNICILNGDLPEEIVDEVEFREVRNENGEIVAEADNEQQNDAVIKRIAIMNALPLDNL